MSVPSLFGMFKSGAHQSLSERRRNNHIELMITDMTMTAEIQKSEGDKSSNDAGKTSLPQNTNTNFPSVDTLPSGNTVGLQKLQ